MTISPVVADNNISENNLFQFIKTPENISFQRCETLDQSCGPANNLEWIVKGDQSLDLDYHFQVYVDGHLRRGGKWISEIPIIVNIDYYVEEWNLIPSIESAGIHKFTIEVYAILPPPTYGIYENYYIYDSVEVNILAPTKPRLLFNRFMLKDIFVLALVLLSPPLFIFGKFGGVQKIDTSVGFNLIIYR